MIGGEPHYDVVIAGGGMVGTALACALGESALQVALLESHPPEAPSPTANPGLRVSAISPASARILRHLGAWQSIVDAGRLCAYRAMEVWDAAGSGRIRFDAGELGADELGWIVENHWLQWSLAKAAMRFGNVDVLAPAELALVGNRDTGLHLQLADGRTLQTRLLVGADGANSRVRHHAGIDVRGEPYGQRGVVATVRTERPHLATARQRFLADGPLAFLPLFNGACSIVWSLPDVQADTVLALDDQAFRLALGEAFEWHLGEITACGPRAGFPLRLQHAERYVRPRLALIGDAAHVVHPLAGQGVNLGLLDAAALAQVLREAGGRDPGGLGVLRRYERWRRGYNTVMVTALDGIKHLFASSSPALQLARNFGLSLADATPPLKAFFARQAMGQDGDLPRLAQAGRVEDDVRGR